VLWLLLTPSVTAKELRIAIAKQVRQLQIGTSTDAVLRDARGQVLTQVTAMDAFSVQARGNLVSSERAQASQLILEPRAGGYVWIGDRWYRGRVRLIVQNQGVTALNLVDFEEYLYSVVGAEAIPSWPLEALKAQAVAARTYALYKSSTAQSLPFDLDTTTSTQVYKGLESEYVSTHEAVNSTQGQILTYNNKPILAVFHASSGGHTENVEDVWSSALPYLRGVVDYDQLSPVFQWSKSFTSAELGTLIKGVGEIKAFEPQRMTPNGRIVKIRVVGNQGSQLLGDDQLRKILDLRSTVLTITQNNNSFEFSGRGFGHGIGLSQWGTHYLAQQGITYDRILQHYYKNVRLTAVKP
jgi:stage II sporulation protein D